MQNEQIFGANAVPYRRSFALPVSWWHTFWNRTMLYRFKRHQHGVCCLILTLRGECLEILFFFSPYYWIVFMRSTFKRPARFTNVNLKFKRNSLCILRDYWMLFAVMSMLYFAHCSIWVIVVHNLYKSFLKSIHLSLGTHNKLGHSTTYFGHSEVLANHTLKPQIQRPKKEIPWRPKVLFHIFKTSGFYLSV